MYSCWEDSSRCSLSSAKSTRFSCYNFTAEDENDGTMIQKFVSGIRKRQCLRVGARKWGVNLAGLGSFLAPAELVEQQVVGGHDGGGSVGGECVYDLWQRVAQRLRHVRQHGRVEILRTQPGKQREGERERERGWKKLEWIIWGVIEELLVRNDEETVQLWFDDFFNREKNRAGTVCASFMWIFSKGIIARRSHTWLHFHAA